MSGKRSWEPQEHAVVDNTGMRRAHVAIAAALTCACVAVLYWPTLRFALLGDDFLLVQLGHRASHDFRLAFASLDAFYRPSTTWTLMLDRAAFGQWAGGYHLTNFFLRLTSSLLVIVVARRLGLGTVTSAAVALVWACSPFTAEPVYVVGARIDELLGLSWLALIALWPSPDKLWERWRKLAVAGVIGFATFTKETWVVTVALVLVLELVCHRVPLRRALRSATWVLAPVCVYVALHVALLPSAPGYFSFDSSTLAKLPVELAAFLHLGPLVPTGFTLSPGAILAALLVAALAVQALRLGSRAALVGLALMALPQLPTLFVPFLPTRHTAVPYLGFLLLAAGVLSSALPGFAQRWRRPVLAGAAGLAGLVWLSGVVTLQADLLDIKGASDLHAELVDEAREIARDLPLGQPVLVVRAERHDPLRELAMGFTGTPKLFFHRREDAYGLVDSAALLEWARAEEGVFFRRATAADRADGGSRVILVHEQGRFAVTVTDASAAAALVRRLTTAGFPSQVLIATTAP